MKYMMENSYIKFAVAVAANCSKHAAPNTPSTPKQAAAHIEEILDLLYSGTGIEPQVTPLVYPSSSKMPLIITLNDDVQRLLWYYPQMTIPELANELEGLLSDVAEQVLCVSA